MGRHTQYKLGAYPNEANIVISKVKGPYVWGDVLKIP